MTIDISLQQLIVTIILGTISLIGFRYGDSSTKWAQLFFVGIFSTFPLIVYWILQLFIYLF